MILSILIPTLPERKHFLDALFDHIDWQIKKLINTGRYIDLNQNVIEIIVDNRGREITTGEKRNYLLARASGEYVWFIDDDDWISDDAIERVMNAAGNGPDVIAIDGYMTTGGVDRKGFEIRIGHPYKAIQRDGKEFYLRFPNHITPMKRSIALMAKFQHITTFEDFNWAKMLDQMNVFKTQEIINVPIYHYRFQHK